jgi:excisionase family DNA binding protein
VSEPPELFSLEEAAERLRVTRTWLLRQATAQTVESTRMGRKVLFTAQQLLHIIDDRSQPAVKAPTHLRTHR